MFDMSNDSHLFRTRSELDEAGFTLRGNRFVKGEGENQEVWLPLYEAKMIHQFDHRYGDFSGLEERPTNAPLRTPIINEYQNPCFVLQPWYWIKMDDVNSGLHGYYRDWFICFRNVARSTDEHSAIFSITPKVGVGNSAPILKVGNASSKQITMLAGNISSSMFDWVVRQKLAGINMNFFYVEQMPVLNPNSYENGKSHNIVRRVIELTYTSWDIKPFADDVWRDVDEELRKAIRAQWEENREVTGGHPWNPPDWAEIADDGISLPPFKWDEERRAHLRAELDAIYARLYGINRKQLRYNLDPADLTEKELENILDDYEEIDDPLDEEAYIARCETSTFPGETFRVLKEKEIKQYGFYRTRHLVLQAWQSLNKAEGDS